MRVITESEGTDRLILKGDGFSVASYRGGGHSVYVADDMGLFVVSPHVPTEALLAIVADRLNRKGQTHPALRMSIDELCAAARSPDTRRKDDEPRAPIAGVVDCYRMPADSRRPRGPMVHGQACRRQRYMLAIFGVGLAFIDALADILKRSPPAPQKQGRG